MSVPVGGNLAGALKKLKRVYDSDVAGPLRRHAHYVPPGERRRRKARKAREREAKRAAREAGSS